MAGSTSGTLREQRAFAAPCGWALATALLASGAAAGSAAGEPGTAGYSQRDAARVAEPAPAQGAPQQAQPSAQPPPQQMQQQRPAQTQPYDQAQQQGRPGQQRGQIEWLVPRGMPAYGPRPAYRYRVPGAGPYDQDPYGRGPYQLLPYNQRFPSSPAGQ